MRVVSDTSPIHYLVLIGEARVLPALFGTLSIPIEVIRELAHSRSPGVVREWVTTPPFVGRSGRPVQFACRSEARTR